MHAHFKFELNVINNFNMTMFMIIYKFEFFDYFYYFYFTFITFIKPSSHQIIKQYN